MGKVYKVGKTKFQASIRILATNTVVLVSAASFVTSAASSISNIIQKKDAAFSLAIAIASFLVLIVKTIFGFVKQKRKISSYYFLDNSKGIKEIFNKVKEQEKEYVETDVSLITYNNELNKYISNERIDIKLKGKYRIPDELKDYFFVTLTSRIKDKITFTNDKKISMITDLDVNTKEVTFMKSLYYDSEVTNDLGIKKVGSKTTPTFCFDGSKLLFDANGNLKKLSDNGLANRIGASCLIKTSDDYYMLQVQGTNSAHNKLKLIPSCSGSCDFEDYKKGDTLKDFVIKSMERELAEEASIEKDEIETMNVIGYGRIIERGAKPEFFGFGTVKLTRKELEIRHDNNEDVKNKFQLDWIFKTREELDELLKNSKEQSIQLKYYSKLEY